MKNEFLSAHRVTDALLDYVGQAEERGIQVFIVGAGGGCAFGWSHSGKNNVASSGSSDSVEDIARHGCTPVHCANAQRHSCWNISDSGMPVQANAGLFAASIIALSDSGVRDRLKAFREEQTKKVLADQIVD